MAIAIPPPIAVPAVRTQVAAITPPLLHRVAKPHDESVAVVKLASQPLRPGYAHADSAVYAPILPAFASQTPPAPRAPTLQRASAGLPDAPVPYVGSALGMARTGLAAPVPMSDAGASYGR